jgi:hypothetical protein
MRPRLFAASASSRTFLCVKRALVLSRGIIGDKDGTPKIACPLHKKNFSLRDGACLTGEVDSLTTYAVKVEGSDVHVELLRSTCSIERSARAACAFADPGRARRWLKLSRSRWYGPRPPVRSAPLTLLSADASKLGGLAAAVIAHRLVCQGV